MLGEEEPSLFDLHAVEERWRKSTEEGSEAGARILREDGNVAELYDEFDDGRMEGDRSSDGDFAGWTDRLEGEDRRIHRRRLSQSLSRP